MVFMFPGNDIQVIPAYVYLKNINTPYYSDFYINFKF
jgi:hypothetical protein